MRAVSTVVGTMMPIDRADVDTDQIIPQQFLKRIERDGYGDFLFYNWAHEEDGSPRADFVVNDPARTEARVLVAGPNFGCGSSREHAVWALQDWGFEAVLAPSMADIFKLNAANNGLLAVELDHAAVRSLITAAADPAAAVTIDLAAQTVAGAGLATTFQIDPITKQRLLEGTDQIGATLEREHMISVYEVTRPVWLPSAGATGAAASSRSEGD